MLLTWILIISIPPPLTLSFQADNLPFLLILPIVASPFFFVADSTDFPDCLPILPFFLLFSFSVVHFSTGVNPAGDAGDTSPQFFGWGDVNGNIPPIL